ncbi:MAG TPA: lysophospholipid acyltransferase family protein [Acidobacteriota bacterium]|nr:lysophospholipid acyltransferase family protein [Acidobacteriota bacterium]
MAEPMNPGYRMMRAFSRFWVKRFFRRIQVLGTENTVDGPAIFAMNHPNNLIDSLIVSYAIDRKIHYLATAQLFRNRLLSMFLHNMGVIPVYRKQDDAAHGEKNVSMFQACYDILHNGGAIGIYPEGTTHAEPRVRRIKTGAARIALESEQLHQPGVRIVPVGLNFTVRKSFRGEVLVRIGTPISVSPYMAPFHQNPVETVDRLTADLQEAMEQEVMHVDAPELEQLLRDIENIYKGELIRDLIEEQGVALHDIDSFRLSKKLVEGIHFFNQRNPELVLHIRDNVRSYTSRLKKARLRDEMVRRITENKTSYRIFLWRIFLLLIGLPGALYGGINHFLPYEISRWVSRKVAKRETDYATVRILCGILLYPLFYAAQIYWVMEHWGWMEGLIYGITLPVFGAFAYYYWEKFKRLRGELQLFFVMITRKQLVRLLQKQREHLIAEMDQAREEYLNAGAQA